MALTLTVEAGLQSVLVSVPVPAGHNRLAVYRTGPSGVRAYVRAYAEATVTPSSTVLVRDFEAPLNVPLVYTADTWAAATPGTVTHQTGTVTVPAPDCDDTWLTDLARGNNTQQIVIEALDELAYEIPTGAHRVLGRRSPIVTSGPAWTPSFELAFLTDTDDARERARATLGNGIPVLLRTPPENGIGSLYLSVINWSEQRIVKAARVQDRRFLVSCIQVDRPDPDLFTPVAPVTYTTVKAGFATYAELKAERASYDAVLYDYATSQPADVVPWPPDDV
jgi:hypothetical protein